MNEKLFVFMSIILSPFVIYYLVKLIGWAWYAGKLVAIKRSFNLSTRSKKSCQKETGLFTNREEKMR